MSIKLKIRPFVHTQPKSSEPSDNIPPSPAPEKRSNVAPSTESNPILQQIENIFKYSLNLTNKKKDHQSGMEHRDRVFQSQYKYAQQQLKNDEKIEEWIGEVCRNVVSTTFHNYLNENMTFKQAKVFCCQAILRNIGQFAQTHDVTDSFFKKIDKIMKEKVMPYLALKYPLSQHAHPNRVLNKTVKEINNMEVLSNDFFYNSDITLKYRQNGNYNDIIMRVLNQIISLADREVNNNNSSDEGEGQDLTNFKDFDDYITQFFDKVYDPSWMTQKSSKMQAKDTMFREPSFSLSGFEHEKPFKDLRSMQQLQKYKQKVHEYTHYDIGRKIPQNITCFTEQQIRSGHLTIKSPQILRIMTKWCEQLWVKFQNQNYYIDKAQGITTLNSKQINILYEWIKVALKKLLKDEKAKIQRYMASVQTNLYEQEFKILQSELLSNEAPFLNRYQRVCGKFSTKVINNLKNCVVVYLNRLIHGLMSVSDTIYKAKMKGMPSWPSAPNLLSFKVGDLLRCRISSRQNEIVRLYQQLLRISQSTPDKLKIIRVKNRLKSGTNDLLINVRFNSQYIAQIQLKVLTNISQSRFETCSYKFAHFIYQIQRSFFGPISQMCNIWTYHDPRTSMYQQLVNKQNLNVNMSQFQYTCLIFGTQHQNQSIINSPFICSKCGKSYSSDNFVLSHKKCKICNYYQCCLCQIGIRQNKDLMDQLIHDQNLKQHLFPQRCQSVPKLGVCIKIESTEGQINMFKVIEVRQKLYLFFVKNDGSFELRYQLKTEKERSKFLKQNVVYQYCGEEPQIFKSLTLKKALMSYIQPLHIRNCYRFQRQALSLNQVSQITFEASVFAKLLGNPTESKKGVKQLQISNHTLTHLNFIPSELTNLQLINVNFNQLTNIDALAKFKKMKTIYCLSNNLTAFPGILCSLPLKVLSIGQNKIKKLPQQFEQLKALQIIRFDSNGMEEFPIVLTKLFTLKQIYANNNKIRSLPAEISRLVKLRLLKVDINKLQSLPQELQYLYHLEFLDVSNNNLTEIPINLKKLRKLKQIFIKKNRIQAIPPQLNQCKQLLKLNLQDNNFKVVSFDNISLANIIDIKLQNCKIKSLESMSTIRNVTSLRLSQNLIENLTPQFCQLKYLKVLDLEKNKLTTLPNNIHQLFNLQSLNLSLNQKITLPPTFNKLKISTLKLNKCGLQTFPLVITQIKLLKQLQIGSNLLRNIPSDIRELKLLEIFMFGNNMISSLPSELTQLKKLKRISFKQKCPFIINNVLIVFFRMLSLNLDLSKCQIEELPEQIYLNTDIQNLNLQYNKIKTIPASFINLTSLKILNLSFNKLIELHQAVFELKDLNNLNISNNLLKELPNKFNQLPKLNTLDFSSNKLTSIPSSLEHIFRRDFRLNYSGNNITRTPSWMISKDFTSTALLLSNANLEKLPRILSSQSYKTKELSKNKFHEFPIEILSLIKTQELNLSYNQIKQIPRGIKKMTNLKNLYLSYNLIEQIPSQLCSLFLDRLQIDNNPLKKIPESMSKLWKLYLRISPSTFQMLKINQCLQYIRPSTLMLDKLQLSDLPKEFGELGGVKNINLSGNLLLHLPECIINIKQLTILNISEQPLQSLPQSIDELINLSQLTANNCNLTQLPPSIGKLGKILKINLSCNHIRELPSQMVMLSNLNRLQVNNNQLTQVPSFLWKLPKCTKVYMSDNQITHIPEKIVSSVIRELDLSNNLIELVPSCLQKMKLGPNSLTLHGNPIKQVQNFQKLKDKFSLQTVKYLYELNLQKKKK